MAPINRFNLNINNPVNVQAKSYKNFGVNEKKGDLRDIYSVRAQFNNFNSYLNSQGISYEQFVQMQWEAKMAAQQQKELNNQTAGQNIVSSFQSIVGGIKSIFGL